ncbi:hypothetical protein GCM10010299_13960 [Streptomyces tanashiensis]|nr:hypothetical protein GCM10010299_13960 [Streptomyces tanashiensis]
MGGVGDATRAGALHKLLDVLHDAGKDKRRALHPRLDLFAVPFTDIAPIVDRSPETTQRIASRAR